MARKILTAAQAAETPGEQLDGVTFVKNQTNEVIKFADGTTHQFANSRTRVTDPELIEKLREAAAKPGNPYGIFEAQGA